jgi:hypothetical protein
MCEGSNVCEGFGLKLSHESRLGGGRRSKRGWEDGQGVGTDEEKLRWRVERERNREKEGKIQQRTYVQVEGLWLV